MPATTPCITGTDSGTLNKQSPTASSTAGITSSVEDRCIEITPSTCREIDRTGSAPAATKMVSRVSQQATARGSCRHTPHRPAMASTVGPPRRIAIRPTRQLSAIVDLRRRRARG